MDGLVTVRWHPHRRNWGTDLPKEYVHVSSWAGGPRAFHKVIFRGGVTVKSVYDPNNGCGCTEGKAAAWAETQVKEADISWDETTIYIGKKSGRARN